MVKEDEEKNTSTDGTASTAKPIRSPGRPKAWLKIVCWRKNCDKEEEKRSNKQNFNNSGFKLIAYSKY